MRTQSYQIANKTDSRKIAEFLSKDGQLLLPFLELICNTEQAVDELIDEQTLVKALVWPCYVIILFDEFSKQPFKLNLAKHYYMVKQLAT